MNVESLLARAMQVREAQALHVVFTGPDYAEPFHAYAKDVGQRDRWMASERAKGNSAEVVVS